MSTKTQKHKNAKLILYSGVYQYIMINLGITRLEAYYNMS